MRYIISLAFAFIFFSCKDDSANNLMVYKVMDEALLQSNEIISMSNSAVYNSMDEQLAAPETSAAMAVWQPKARRIKALSDSMVRLYR